LPTLRAAMLQPRPMVPLLTRIAIVSLTLGAVVAGMLAADEVGMWLWQPCPTRCSTSYSGFT
jgi:hypothetical protein